MVVVVNPAVQTFFRAIQLEWAHYRVGIRPMGTLETGKGKGLAMAMTMAAYCATYSSQCSVCLYFY